MKERKTKLKFKEWITSIDRIRGDSDNRYGAIRLDKNERVTPFPKKIWNDIIASIESDHVNAYPEPEKLYQHLAKYHCIDPRCFVVTAGSDAAIRNAFDLSVNPGDTVVSVNPTYAMVEVYADLYGAKKRFISYNSDLSLSVSDMISAMTDDVSLVIIANPNSPTGTIMDRADLENIVSHAETKGILVLIDEAYYEFCGQSCSSFIDRFSNVMITRTFSKAWGLAGLRIGYIMASPKLASLLYKFRPLYEVNSIGLHFAHALLDHKYIVDEYVQEVQRGREFFIKELKRLNLLYKDTYTNFIHINCKNKKKDILCAFAKQSITVRGGLPSVGFEDYLRITLGPIPIMKKVISCLEDVV